MSNASGSIHRPMWLGRAAKAFAAIAVGFTLLAPGLSLACDDDYPAPTGWAPYAAQQPEVVMVDPRDQYDRYEHWRRERAARAYWSWRARQHSDEYRHHRHGRWD